jgi:pyridoxamine 5'-phosphate oxidase
MQLPADIRKEYMQHTLDIHHVSSDPFHQFGLWWQEAIDASIDEINAMTLATSSADGVPSARIVLLKGYDKAGFVFYTNYESAKGRELEENPRACLVFFWKELERQIRITGIVRKVSSEESDAYFNSRPENSRIGALVSPQSQVIPDRQWLEQKEEEVRRQHHLLPAQRPSHWGGYRVMPVKIEFWQGRPSRLHDRLQYQLQEDGNWKLERLAP